MAVVFRVNLNKMLEERVHKAKAAHSKDVEQPFLRERASSEPDTEPKGVARLAPCLRCALLIFILVLVVILFLSQTLPEFNQRQSEKSSEQTAGELEKQTRVVLLWNDEVDDSYWKLPADGLSANFLRADLKCPVYNCEITTKQDYLTGVDLYDAIVFHTANTFPTSRHSEQIYIFAEREPSEVILNDEANFYNWTMMYRMDSDVQWLHHYIEDIEVGVIVAPSKFPNWRKPPTTYNDTKLLNIAQNKTHMFISHCDALSQTDNLTETLKNYIDTDVFGKCGNSTCRNHSGECNDLIDGKYMFYFAFESWLCPDCDTEKLFVALERNIIPVVFGGADFSSFLPPNSYIKAANFKSAEELAKYLNHLASHPVDYIQFFWWRQYYKLRTYSPYCKLCEKLHTTSVVNKKQSYTNIRNWLYNESIYSEARQSEEEFTTDSPRSILLWNDLFGDQRWGLPTDIIGPNEFREDLKCPVYNCKLTNKRGDLLTPENYDAIIFHTAQPFPLLNAKPEQRNPEQVYVFAQMEFPGETKHSLSDEVDFYNWTMTYRLDSDILWPYQYIEDIETGIVVAPAKFPVWRKPPTTWNDTEVWNTVKQKTHKAVLFPLNCDTLSKSDKLVGALQKYLEVDIYGNLTCSSSSKQCDELLNEKYQFYLSFETSLCTDYVTDKLYNVLRRQIVPIVYGGADYSRFLPPYSFINADLFQNVQELAEYLNHLSSHPEEYMRYFWWRQYYKLKSYSPFCELCAKLNDRSFKTVKQTYTNIEDWWLSDTCFEPSLEFVNNEETNLQRGQLLITDKRSPPCGKGEIRDHRDKCRKIIKFIRSRRPQTVRSKHYRRN